MAEDPSALLAKLRSIRASGVREVEYNGGRVAYRDDAELAAAIADLERRIAGSSNRVNTVMFATNKGI